MGTMKSIFRTVIGIVSLVASTNLLAQAYPAHTVRLVVPCPQGGSVELIARVVAKAARGGHIQDA